MSGPSPGGNGNGDSDDSFSSDSDDEFLTLRGDGKGVDREALVRKKLLESFYGKTDVGHSGSGTGGDGEDSSDDDSNDEDDSMASTDDEEDDECNRNGGFYRRSTRRRRRRQSRRALSALSGNGDENDLDSVHFDAAKHTERYLLQSSVHPLLETEESLACQVRTLDSSMQTLVYENYSRFIEATEAVRNIGVNVQCNAGNLQKLSASVLVVGETARDIETTCGKLRDSVVEKLRTKRLLQRLESLLKLPSTLRESIGSGRYRWATKSYLKACAILQKQSDGFESLQRIEQECYEIMEVLLEDARNKLLHWSGNYNGNSYVSASVSGEDTPDPPETVAGIFECAGTPVLILNHQKQADQTAGRGAFDTGLTAEQCQEMSLDACLRLIERFLDTHHIELQEILLANSMSNNLDGSANAKGGDTAAQLSSGNDGAASGGGNGSRLIPTNVLDSILEASALYSVTFPTSHGQSSEPLSKFVTAAFYSFLQHDERSDRDEDDEGQDDSEDQAYEHIANATALLLESVQQFSSALALPEVTIDETLAASLVDQTAALSQAMVRRRVDQKFYVLRFRVLQNCLAPFCRQALQNDALGSKEEGGETTQERIDRVVQMASVALSDSSQLVDDTVRSILSSSTSNNASSTSTNTNNATLKTAVEQSTARFAAWLAVALEILAGCESSDPKYVLDILPDVPEESENDKAASNIIHPALFRRSRDPNDDDNALAELVENAMSELLEELEELAGTSHRGGSSARSYLTLAIAEMCRLAQRTVVDDIHQSIATHTGSIHKHRSAQAADGLFATTLAAGGSRNGDTNGINTRDPNSMRFRLAASRVLGLYAMNRGNEASELISSDLYKLSRDDGEEEEEATGPRVGAWSLLSVVKSTAFDCAGLFGGPKRAGPVPEDLEDEFVSLTMARQNQAFRSTLAIDVERMFAEKVFAYPHPFENFGFDRNFVVFQVLKVAFKALREDVRLVRFTNRGYRQLLVDLEFLKFMMPHYVNDAELVDHSTTNPITTLESLLTEAIKTAKERCDTSAMLHDDSVETNQARAVVREFMATNGADDGLTSRFTIPEDDDEEAAPN
eukprot:jgi/Psemu1/223392/e_gw1.1329.7.1